MAKKVLKKFKHQSGDFIFCRTSTWRSSRLEKLMRPVNEERNRLHAEMASAQLLAGYFMQYNNLLFNCEWQYLKLVNLDLYRIFEPFWRGKMHCRFIIVGLVRAGMNMIFKFLWKLIVDKKKEHVNS